MVKALCLESYGVYIGWFEPFVDTINHKPLANSSFHPSKGDGHSEVTYRMQAAGPWGHIVAAKNFACVNKLILAGMFAENMK